MSRQIETRCIHSNFDFSYQVLKGIDLTELNGAIYFDDNALSVKVDGLKLLLILIHEEVATKGLSANQNTVTKYGRSLYTLYDELFAQKQ